jgi:hypothetical protein
MTHHVIRKRIGSSFSVGPPKDASGPECDQKRHAQSGNRHPQHRPRALLARND